MVEIKKREEQTVRGIHRKVEGESGAKGKKNKK